MKRAWKGIEDKEEEGFEDDEGFDTTISKSLSIDSLLEDKPVSSLLDLTSCPYTLWQSSLSDAQSKNDESRVKGGQNRSKSFTVSR